MISLMPFLHPFYSLEVPISHCSLFPQFPFSIYFASSLVWLSRILPSRPLKHISTMSSPISVHLLNCYPRNSYAKPWSLLNFNFLKFWIIALFFYCFYIIALNLSFRLFLYVFYVF